MHSLNRLATAAALCLLSSTAGAGSLEDGIGALDRGDTRAAAAAFKEAANDGNPEAMVELGRMSLDGVARYDS